MAATRAESTLRISRVIKAPRAKVFAAWTSPEQVRKWCAPGDMECSLAEMDVRVGGQFRIHMTAPGPDGATHKAVGEYKVVDAPSRLVYTWRWEGGDANMGQDTLITMEFVEKGKDVTEVTMVHELPNEESKQQHEKGWIGCFDKFEKLFPGS